MEMQVDPDVLMTAAAQYRSAANQVRDMLGSLSGTAHSLTSAAVLGDARTAADFDTVWGNWSGNLQQLVTALDNVASALETTARNYIDLEDRVIVVQRAGGPQ
jgi:WXG100 family type VII secretion target